MPEVVPEPENDPSRFMPVPTGFPPRRVEEAPPLDDWQLRFASGYTFYHDHSPHSFWGRLFPYQSPLVVLPLQAISSTFTALVLGVFFYYLWKHFPEETVEKIGFKDSIIFVGILVLLAAVSIYSLIEGRVRRMRRWLRFDWESFDLFAQCEAWMQYIGVMDWIGGIMVFTWLIYLLIRTPAG